MLTAIEAAEIARQTGLSLADAVALRLLADSPEEAVDLASRFGGEATDAAFATQLFGGADRPAIEIDETPIDADDAEVLTHLFGRTPTDTTDTTDPRDAA